MRAKRGELLQIRLVPDTLDEVDGAPLVVVAEEVAQGIVLPCGFQPSAGGDDLLFAGEMVFVRRAVGCPGCEVARLAAGVEPVLEELVLRAPRPPLALDLAQVVCVTAGVFVAAGERQGDFARQMEWGVHAERDGLEQVEDRLDLLPGPELPGDLPEPAELSFPESLRLFRQLHLGHELPAGLGDVRPFRVGLCGVKHVFETRGGKVRRHDRQEAVR